MINSILETLKDYILSGMNLFVKLLEILSTQKKYWLLPIGIVLVLFVIIIIYSQGAAIAPFLYMFF
jgi:hypothetical protein